MCVLLVREVLFIVVVVVLDWVSPCCAWPRHRGLTDVNVEAFVLLARPGDDEKAGEDESSKWVEGDVDAMRTQKMYADFPVLVWRSRIDRVRGHLCSSIVLVVLRSIPPRVLVVLVSMWESLL